MFLCLDVSLDLWRTKLIVSKDVDCCIEKVIHRSLKDFLKSHSVVHPESDRAVPMRRMAWRSGKQRRIGCIETSLFLLPKLAPGVSISGIGYRRIFSTVAD